MQPFRKYFLFLFVILFHPTWTKAEYRAFLLQIKTNKPASAPKAPADQNPPAETSDNPYLIEGPRLVKSSLDPYQYRGYYHLRPEESVTYIDTWRCPGNTGGIKEICKSPKELTATQPDENAAVKSPERKPANN